MCIRSIITSTIHLYMFIVMYTHIDYVHSYNLVYKHIHIYNIIKSYNSIKLLSSSFTRLLYYHKISASSHYDVLYLCVCVYIYI